MLTLLLVAAAANCPSTCYQGTCDYWDGGYWGTCQALEWQYGCNCGGCECDGCPQGECGHTPFDPQACPTAGNGMCDSATNHEGCAYDGGDCCADTCIGSLCGSRGYDCKAPPVAAVLEVEATAAEGRAEELAAAAASSAAAAVVTEVDYTNEDEVAAAAEEAEAEEAEAEAEEEEALGVPAAAGDLPEAPSSAGWAPWAAGASLLGAGVLTALLKAKVNFQKGVAVKTICVSQGVPESKPSEEVQDDNASTATPASLERDDDVASLGTPCALSRQNSFAEPTVAAAV